MGFFDTSVTTATSVKQTNINIAQQSFSTPALPSKQTVDSVSTSFVGANNSVSGISALTTGKTSSIQAIEASAIRTVAAVGSSYLQSAVKSINQMFGSSKTGLASGIANSFSGIFRNTNVASAATTTSLVPDPVTKNLLQSKAPASTSFTVNSLISGSQSVSMSGTSSSFGSGASGMTGINLSTLLGRFNLDSALNLGSTLTSAFTTNKVSGLFSNLSATSSPITSNGQLGQALTSITSASIASSLNIIPSSDVLSLSEKNDIASYLSSSDSLKTALGGQDLSSYYLTNSQYSLIDQDGIPVSTNQSGIDASTANSILDIIRQAGCTLLTSNYSSANSQASLFNLGLNLSAKNGMLSEVLSLLGCSHASTIPGQQSLIGAFVSSVGSQLGISSRILGGIQTPAALNTDYVSRSIVTNPNLGPKDVPQVNSIFTTLGSSTKAALSVDNSASDPYPIYNSALLYASPPSFINTVFDDSTITDYFNGSQMNVQSDGSFSLAA